MPETETEALAIDEALHLLHDTRAYWTDDMLRDAASNVKSEADAMLARGDIDNETHAQVVDTLAHAEGRTAGAWAQSRELQHSARDLMQVFAPVDVIRALTQAHPNVSDPT